MIFGKPELNIFNITPFNAKNFSIILTAKTNLTLPPPQKNLKNTSFRIYKQCPNHLVQYLETRDFLPQCSPSFIYVKF